MSKLVTHTYWVNKSAGKKFADPDEQCTNLISGRKWCPSYIFGSTSHSIALGNWKTFKALVKKYLDALNAPVVPEPPAQPTTLYYVQTGAYKVKTNADAQLEKVKAAGFDAILKKSGELYRVQVGAYSKRDYAVAMEKKLKAAGFPTYITTTGGTVVSGGATTDVIKVGDKVKCKAGVTKYYNGVGMPSWVRVATLYVRQIEQNGKVYLVSTEPTKKVYTGRVWASDMQKI
ncbi:MAG: SPOR domain-containing protein [Clostridia bacterium]|nr:SPOR domain-containing protein [Clostridia bacterium]MBQ7669153.1 SPOR domain-containing protein [Clostridia bacterium]